MKNNCQGCNDTGIAIVILDFTKDVGIQRCDTCQRLSDSQAVEIVRNLVMRYAPKLETKDNTRTPKTLTEAIFNGLAAARSLKTQTDLETARLIRLHVIDYLSQRFSVSMFGSEKLVPVVLYNLWHAIKKEEETPPKD